VYSFSAGLALGFCALTLISNWDRHGLLSLPKSITHTLKSFRLKQSWGLFENPKSKINWNVPVKRYESGNMVNLYDNSPLTDFKKAQLLTEYGDNHRLHKLYGRLSNNRYKRYRKPYLEHLCKRELAKDPGGEDFFVEIYRVYYNKGHSIKKKKVIESLACK